MVCNSPEDLPGCREGYSHASGGGENRFHGKPVPTCMLTSTLTGKVLQTEMLAHLIPCRLGVPQHAVALTNTQCNPKSNLQKAWMGSQHVVSVVLTPGVAAEACLCIQADLPHLGNAYNVFCL